VLMFIGTKMLVSVRYQIPTWIALLVIALVLAVSIFVSILFPKEGKEASSATPQA